MIGIYKITNPKGSVYIGQSVNINKRFYQYKILTNCNGQTKLYNSLKKYGVEKHTFDVVEICCIENLNNSERYWQDYYNVLSKNGLNCRLTKTNDKSGRLSDETKAKISKANKGMAGSMLGKKHSIETVEKIRIGNIGKVVSDDVRSRLSKINSRGNHPKSKTVLNVDNGIFYECIRDASETYGYNNRTLCCYLSGSRKNKSNLILV